MVSSIFRKPPSEISNLILTGTSHLETARSWSLNFLLVMEESRLFQILTYFTDPIRSTPTITSMTTLFAQCAIAQELVAARSPIQTGCQLK